MIYVAFQVNSFSIIKKWYWFQFIEFFGKCFDILIFRQQWSMEYTGRGKEISIRVVFVTGWSGILIQQNNRFTHFLRTKISFNVIQTSHFITVALLRSILLKSHQYKSYKEYFLIKPRKATDSSLLPKVPVGLKAIWLWHFRFEFL